MKLLKYSPLVCLAFSLTAYAQGAARSNADVSGQGGGPTVSEDGATVIRSKNGVSASLSMPVPYPGTYNYPPGNDFQPNVYIGAPEVFTDWIFIFNHPEECSGRVCNSDDLGPTPAMGGAYNFGGHAVGGSTLNISGHVSIGDTPFGGVALSNPAGAEIHLAIAPHGMLQPEMLPNQINTPIGSPDYWWVAIFRP